MLVNTLGENGAADMQKHYLSQKILNFCVIHHQVRRPDLLPKLDPENKKDISLILNCREFEAVLLKYGIRFLLHGHQHVTYTSVVPHRDTTTSQRSIKFFDALGVGSAGALPVTGYEGFPWNSFSIYTPKDDRLEMQVFNYKSNGDKETKTVKEVGKRYCFLCYY